MVLQHGVQLIQLSMKLSWHIQAPDNKIFREESVTFTDFYVLPTENIGKQQYPLYFHLAGYVGIYARSDWERPGQIGKQTYGSREECLVAISGVGD